MPREELVMFATNDLSGLTRGKSFPLSDLDERMIKGVGWVPANQALNPFSAISADNPFGPMGDLRLIPDPATALRVPIEGASPLHLFLCDIVETDGTPWDCCARLFARRALQALETEAGLRLLLAFEQEFVLTDLPGPPAPAFSIPSLRTADKLAVHLLAALRAAGIEPELFLPEYGAQQYEIVCRPAPGLAAADQAVVVRDLTREIARSLGLTASFAPKVKPDGVGNGVHLHFSFEDRSGRPATVGSGEDEPISKIAGQFVAGVLEHLPALCALVAPSMVSYLRLTPHHWSAAYSCFGYRNREAAVRLCPVLEFPGLDRAAQVNLEFRPADAAASPYLVLGALVNAGLDGIRRELPAPTLIQKDPDGMPEADRERAGIKRLPTSLEAALAALEADETARGWMSPLLLQTYVSMKRSEIAGCASLGPQELCDKYAAIY